MVGCVAIDLFIDREAREIIRSVASVRPSVCLCVCFTLCVFVSNQKKFAIKGCAQRSGAFNLIIVFPEETWCPKLLYAHDLLTIGSIAALMHKDVDVESVRILFCHVISIFSISVSIQHIEQWNFFNSYLYEYKVTSWV